MVGVWLIGARGSVATTATVGAAALAANLVPPVGLVTELPPFTGLPLPAIGDLVFGGHDVIDTPLVKRAEELASAGVLPARLLPAVAPALIDTDTRVRRGIDGRDRGHPLDTAQRVATDLASFRREQGLDHVVVVNVASTEASWAPHPAHADLALLDEALEQGLDVLPPSSLYAYAAFQAGCSFVDFTPSTGARLPALEQLAEQRGVPHAGRDGKTGETLVKSALAPMFVEPEPARPLMVRNKPARRGGRGGARGPGPACEQARVEAAPSRVDPRIRARRAAAHRLRARPR